MADNSLGTPEQLRDPNYFPNIFKAVPLGIQHVLAMFASNVTPAIIIAGVAGFGFGSNSPDFPNLIYMIQMAMLFAGVATLIQTISLGPIGAKLPIVQGTSFAFLPIMIPAVVGQGVGGMAGLMTGVVIGGVFHFLLGLFIGRIRFALPPLVTGLIVLMIGLALVKVGIQYAAGGVPAEAKLKAALAAAKASGNAVDYAGIKYGTWAMWIPALVVIFVTLIFKFFTRGFLSVAAILIGLIAGYIVAYFMGQVNFANIARAAEFALPEPFKFGWRIDWAIIIGMCLMSFISAIETVGDVSGITKGGAQREATDKEISGATYADGLGTAIAGAFGSLPNTSFSQNVGLISMTGVMSRHVVTIGALFLILCGFLPKVGAAISTIPINVLGGGVIVMFGMVAAAGVSMLSDVRWNRRNMVIFATALAVGLGLQLVPDALHFVPKTLKILLTSGLLPAAVIAILLNLLLPEDLDDDDAHAAMSGLDIDHGAPHGGRTATGTMSGSVGSGSVGGATAAMGGAAAAVGGVASSAAGSASSAAGSVASGASGAMSSASAAVSGGISAATGAGGYIGDGEGGFPIVDDVQLIDGIGDKITAEMKSRGVNTLSQIAAMSDAELEALANSVGATGNHIKQEWKVQANEMLSGKPPRSQVDKDLAMKLAGKA